MGNIGCGRDRLDFLWLSYYIYRMIEPKNKINIRRFGIEDYDAVLKLWQDCRLPFKPYGRDSREKIAKEITKETAIFLVAERDGEVIGTVLGTHDGRKGWINRLAVDPKYRRQGIAQRLLEEAEEKIYQKGIEIVTCLIEDYNQTSMDFFQKAGYTKHTDIIYFSKRKNPQI